MKVKSQQMSEDGIKILYDNGVEIIKPYIKTEEGEGYLEMCPNEPETFYHMTPKDYYSYPVIH